MGTFHQDKGELHGITVVVDTVGPTVYIGRCHEMDDERILLLDVDEHEDGQDGLSKQAFIQKAARMGVWKKHAHISLPRAQVASVTLLGDVPLD